MKCNQKFNIEGYKNLLIDFKEIGYEFRSFGDFDKQSAHVLLRHDVDYDVGRALSIAKVENELNISSVYHVLIRSKFYNPFDPDVVSKIKEIVGLGHTVGLHFDAALYESNFDVLQRACAEECCILEEIVGRKVEDISFHRPAAELLGCDQLLSGRRHSYQPKYFTEIGYCSDSQGRFRYGHPLEHEAVKNRRALQLVLHPIWWSENEAISPIERINEFLSQKSTDIKVAMAENSLVYRAYFAKDEAE
ncbi:hypothetical protein [Thalassospira sp.]|uniref:hypothetical protein n=1 Tax=Thalassospira sp. TaxID=1912094 RepID=UPI000C5CFE32|nr:hypothetical protein [Thalassospira sp.]MAL41048.1 hypothetical protein [Thalassospira sp.]|tara:strand:- start:6712 stop:7455 length:744 start_codon:yes stop_codon:yes gene_type:complete